jgi:hypothetical protein
VTRIAVAGLVVIALVLGIGFMREQLETRHQTMPPGSRLVVDATADVRGAREHAPALARGLVSACLVEAAASSDVTSFEFEGDERFRFIAQPALDEPDRRQLLGCLEDIRVPRLLVSVNKMTTELAPA